MGPSRGYDFAKVTPLPRRKTFNAMLNFLLIPPVDLLEKQALRARHMVSFDSFEDIETHFVYKATRHGTDGVAQK
jgi:hypothetical protein